MPHLDRANAKVAEARDERPGAARQRDRADRRKVERDLNHDAVGRD
jgi:hypothetical protein